MNLSIYNEDVFKRYKSNSQRVRVLTENWMQETMFCPVCSNLKIKSLPNNTPVADFFCPRCNEQFQLKSQKNKFGKKILDGAFQKMIESIQRNLRPNFFLLHYNLDYYVNNLFLIPYFFFTESIIEKRKPLSENAQRAGWAGCNISLSKVPPEGKIWIIEDGIAYSKSLIADQWKKVSFIKDAPLSERGWTLDILRVVHSLGKKEFTLKEVYGYEEELSKDHPTNYHIKAKIRQQLQILRGKGFLKFKERGNYLVLK